MPKKKQGPKTKTKPKSKSTKAASKKTANKTTNTTVKLPNVLLIAKTSWQVLWNNRKTFLLITLIYGIAYLILVLGLSSPNNIGSIKKEFSGVFHGNLGTLYSGVGIFAYLVGSSTTSSTSDGSAYQIFLIIIASLCIIWALRQAYLGTKIRARDGFYHGLYPLAQYILVLLFIILELLPLVAGLGLYGLLVTGGIAVTFIEKFLSIILCLGLVGFSFYLVSSSIIALYIVTLPDMTPFKALRSAKGLVKGRRWSVFRKIVFLPILLLIVIGILILPFIFIAPAVAGWLFFILSLLALVYIHSYLYSLYRGLIND